MNGTWNYPTPMRFGAGRIAELPGACRELGIKRPLLVTDRGLAALPMVAQAIADNEAGGLPTALFSDVRGNPVGQNVLDGVDAFGSADCDGVIAFGGGSALDVGKSVALMVGQTRPMWDFEDIGDNWTRVDAQAMAPVVAVPTTAGTGSEVGRAAVITQQSTHTKRILFHPKMLPGRVICDPELTVGLPATLTGWVGMDALSHSLEAFCAPGWHPMADGIAVEGMLLVRAALERAVADGSDLEARSMMMAASTMGATAFQKGLGGMHAMSHPIGALLDAHHGLTNAIVMPYVLVRNRERIAAGLGRVAAYIELEDPSFEGFLSWVLQLRETLGIPHTLESVGMDQGHIGQMAQMAEADSCTAGNPVSLVAADYEQLYRRALSGRL